MVKLYMRLGRFLGGGLGGPPPHGSLNIFEPMAVRVKTQNKELCQESVPGVRG